MLFVGFIWGLGTLAVLISQILQLKYLCNQTL